MSNYFIAPVSYQVEHFFYYNCYVQITKNKLFLKNLVNLCSVFKPLILLCKQLSLRFNSFALEQDFISRNFRGFYAFSMIFLNWFVQPLTYISPFWDIYFIVFVATF